MRTFRCIQCLDELVWWLGLHGSGAGDGAGGGRSSKLWAKSSVWAAPRRIRPNSWACRSLPRTTHKQLRNRNSSRWYLDHPVGYSARSQVQQAAVSCVSICGWLEILPYTLNPQSWRKIWITQILKIQFLKKQTLNFFWNLGIVWNIMGGVIVALSPTLSQ